MPVNTRTVELSEAQWDLVTSLIDDELDTRRLELKKVTDADDYEFLQQTVRELEDLDSVLAGALRR